MNFKGYIIGKIKVKLFNLKKDYNFDGNIYLNISIPYNDNCKIFKLNANHVFIYYDKKTLNLQLNLYMVKGNYLLEIYQQIKTNNFYIIDSKTKKEINLKEILTEKV